MLLHREDGFSFGLEAEYLLVDAHNFRPLWYRDLSFKRLNDALEAVPLADFGHISGLDAIPPQGRGTPYIIEGYHLFDAVGVPLDILPKGVEIRTPKADTIEETLEHLVVLHERMQTALVGLGYRAVALSHHPLESDFQGEQGPRPATYWPWAMAAMSTYGPDFNISVPKEISERLDYDDLARKVNYYAPALAGLSAASPIFGGRLWQIDGKQGKAARTFKRSPVGQSLELHPLQAGRIEFKPMEMSTRVSDFHAYFLLWLTLLLDDSLNGRASDAERVRDLALASREGIAPMSLRLRAMDVIESAYSTLPLWGFAVDALEPVSARVDVGRTPADEIIELYQKYGNVPDVLRHLSRLVPEAELELTPLLVAAR